MEISICKVVSPQTLMRLEELCSPTVAHYPKLSYFNPYVDNDLNFTTHFNFSNGDNVVIVGEKNGTQLICNPRSFVNSIYTSKLSQPLETLLPLIVGYYKSELVSSIRLRNPPSYIHPTPKFFTESTMELRCTTSVVEAAAYNPSHRRMRAIRRAISNGYSFNVVEPRDYESTWTFLENFLVSRKLPALTYERVLQLLSKFNSSFSLIRVTDSESKLIAAAFANTVGDTIRLPNYYGLRDHEGSTDFLIFEIIKWATVKDIRYVDLGVSIDPSTGMEVDGIVNFKSEHSAIRVGVFDEILSLAT